MAAALRLILRPHLERGGYHRDRFDAYLDGELICTSRSGWHDPARRLLELGHSPETLLYVQHEGREFDPTIVLRSIRELAGWEIEETDRGGLTRRRWRPYNGRNVVGVGARTGDEGSAGIGVPADHVAA
jgi:hypothetical protein